MDSLPSELKKSIGIQELKTISVINPFHLLVMNLFINWESLFFRINLAEKIFSHLGGDRTHDHGTNWLVKRCRMLNHYTKSLHMSVV